MIYHDHYTERINVQAFDESGQKIIAGAELEALEKGFNEDYRLVTHINAELKIIAAEFVHHVTQDNRRYFDDCVSCTRDYGISTASH